MLNVTRAATSLWKKKGITNPDRIVQLRRMLTEDVLTRLDDLPPPREISRAMALEAYDTAVKTTGHVTMTQLEAAGAFSRKTILKHIREGVLPAGKAIVNGKPTWLFNPEDVEAYLSRAADMIEQAVRHKRNRPSRVAAAEGYLTLTDAAAACGISHWALRDHLANAAVVTTLGRHASKMIAEADLPKLQKYFAKIRRAPARAPEPAGLTPNGRVKGGLYFDDFATLFAVMRNQPEVTAEDMVAVTGATLKAAVRWKSGERLPRDEEYRGPLIGLFRQLFNCRLSPDLENLAGWHRRKYMRAYMAERRIEGRHGETQGD